MEFSDEQGKTRLNYALILNRNCPFFFFGSILKMAIEKSMRDVLKRLAERYDARNQPPK
jgi:hypothetical protein